MQTTIKRKKIYTSILTITALVCSFLIFIVHKDIYKHVNTILTHTDGLVVTPRRSYIIVFIIGILSFFFSISTYFSKKIYTLDKNGKPRYQLKYVTKIKSLRIYPRTLTLFGLLLVCIGLTNFYTFTNSALYIVKTTQITQPKIIPYSDMEKIIVDAYIGQTSGRRGRSHCSLDFTNTIIPKSKTEATVFSMEPIDNRYAYEAMYIMSVHGVQLQPHLKSSCNIQREDQMIRQNLANFFNTSF